MPTLSIRKSLLEKHLGASYSKDDVDELCFQYGLELDAVIQEKDESGVEYIVYKIDIPANRYDLLCVEGLSMALKVFQNKSSTPQYKLADVPNLVKILVEAETREIREFVVGAVLRNVNFDKDSYASFIDLQDKLHLNLGRKRTLASVGTHDLDKIKPPIRYRTLLPENIIFCPLNQTKELTAVEQMKLYADSYLREYLHILHGAKKYPIIQDASNKILSMPPITNSEHSKITLNTKNIFIEATGTNLKKLEIFIDTIVTMFGQYCKEQFVIEPVEVSYRDGKTHKYPILEYRTQTVDISSISKQIGISIEKDVAIDLLNKMSLKCTSIEGSGKISIVIPPTRHDILHECDIAEDLALAFGYNKISPKLPEANTLGQPLLLNKFCDHLRVVFAESGWTEVLTFTLCSTDDVTTNIRQSPDTMMLVKISNPKTQDFQVVRNSLLPGLMRTIANNRDMPLPLKFFEVQDVLFVDNEKISRNERHFGAIFYSKSGAFEIVHGLVDRLMTSLGISFSKTQTNAYYIRQIEDNSYLGGRCAEIIYRQNRIGLFGIIHPEVLSSFSLSNPCSYVEINVENFL